MAEICPGKAPPIWISSGKRRVHWLAADSTVPDIKRPRITCELCGRRIEASVQYCHDGCCIVFTIPPHKVKKWWKKGKKRCKTRDKCPTRS